MVNHLWHGWIEANCRICQRILNCLLSESVLSHHFQSLLWLNSCKLANGKISDGKINISQTKSVSSSSSTTVFFQTFYCCWHFRHWNGFETTAGGGYRSMCPQQWIETYQCRTKMKRKHCQCFHLLRPMEAICESSRWSKPTKNSIHEKSLDKLDAEMFIACKCRS